MVGSIAPAGEAEAGSAGEQPARNNQLETHPRRWSGARSQDRALIAWIDFPMPQKTHTASCARTVTSAGGDDCRRSNSAGGQKTRGERKRLSFLIFPQKFPTRGP